MLKIRYNGTRFPRVVVLRNHMKKVYHHPKQEIFFDEYDANTVMKNNSRLSPEAWEFSIVGIYENDGDRVKLVANTVKDIQDANQALKEDIAEKKKRPRRRK